jgi:hypothetical protein
VTVAVAVAVAVAVGVGVLVQEGVAVAVNVRVEVGVGVAVRVLVGDGDMVGVRDGLRIVLVAAGESATFVVATCVGIAVAEWVTVGARLGATVVGGCVPVGASGVTVPVAVAALDAVLDFTRAMAVAVGRALITPTRPIARHRMPDSRLKTIDQTNSRQPRCPAARRRRQ